MVKSVGNLEAAVEEIMALHRSLPPRPSAEEVDAALFLIGNVDATQSTPSITVPSSSSSPPDYEWDAPLSVMNTAKVTENHAAIMDDIAIFEPK
ncbi:hypothetical protein KI387_019020, partial [Taxus chinensis]